MRFLPIAALGTLLLCACRPRSTAIQVPPSSALDALHPSNANQPSPTPDTSGKYPVPLDTITTIPDVVLRYRTAWDTIHATRGPVRIPEFWGLADSAGYALQETMEQFTEATFQRAESLMVWHTLQRIETVGASPVYDSFLALARTRGTPFDTAYFAYLVAEGGGDGKEGWTSPISDFQACDELGSPHLLTSLTGAEYLRTDSATPYRKSLPDPARDVRQSIEYGLCACGKAPATLRDFERNLALAHPPASLRPLLDSLRAILRAPRSKDRFECGPG